MSTFSYNIPKQRAAIFAVIGIALFICTAGAAAASTTVDPVRLRLDTPTLKKGFTVETSGAQVRLGVTPHAVAGEYDEVHVAIKETTVPEKSGKKRVTPVYSFDVFHKTTVDVVKPLWISLAWPESADTSVQYVLKYWDSNHASWLEIPSTENYDDKRTQAAIHLPYAKVALFEEEREVFTGQASWMNHPCAAMLLLPQGTEIIVRNPANGKEVETTVCTTGPFSPPGRIIDLGADAFSELAPLSSGVINNIEVRARN